jgi:DNA-binding beta-propeller fold protein YncE
MDRRISLTVALLAGMVAGTHLYAAESDYRFLSVRTIDGPCCGDWGSDIAVDSDGAVFVAGRRGGLDVNGDGSVDLQTYGTPDSMVLKAFSTGEWLDWVRGPGGAGEDFASGIAPDGHGGAYVVGQFTDQMQAGSEIVTGSGLKDGFLARYDKHGEVVWVRAIGGAGDDRMSDVAVDGEGNVFVVGTIVGEVDVDRDGTMDVKPSGASAMLIASFDPMGTLRFARATAGTARTMGWFASVGRKGELYVGGHYMAGTLDIDGDGQDDVPVAAVEPAGAPPLPDMNGFFARFDPSGDMAWSRSISGPRIQTVGGLAVAGDGDLLVLGAYTDSADLDADGDADIEFESIAGRVWEHYLDANGLLMRLSPAGALRWARRYAASVNSVTSDGSRIVVTGTYTGALDFDDDGEIEREADQDEYHEGVIAILDANGDLLHTFTIVGEDSDAPNAAAFSTDGERLYVTGYTKLGADFSGDGAIESESLCHQLGDVFLAVYDVED